MGMQDFQPEPHAYDLIWCQWVLGHLTDSDFVAFLKRCQKALAPDGVICIKENAINEGVPYYVDKDDSSLGRFVLRACADEKPATKRAKREANPPARRQGDALEAGFNAIKEGLVFLGTSLNSAQQPVSSASTGVTGATLDDVVRALNVQSATMEKLLAHLADKNQ
ncbi:hypothetical protein DYB26_002732 [Aphanomyces astaci]|uniref:Alpha N-terminal protein methyltransferase 1 n=1 Tax=Aphanomyces astaci TaxID=112090 RepID=A0A418FZZ4_APHAT|nr:hypothetical protein DYB26_002732 [Aphanomyces astaci]